MLILAGRGAVGKLGALPSTRLVFFVLFAFALLLRLLLTTFLFAFDVSCNCCALLNCARRIRPLAVRQVEVAAFTFCDE